MRRTEDGCNGEKELTGEENYEDQGGGKRIVNK